MAAKKDAKNEQEAEKSGGKGKLLLILLLLPVLLGGTAAGLYFTGMLDQFIPGMAATAATSAGGEMPTLDKPPVKAPALYLTLDPPFVVNFDEDGILRYLQVTVAVMSREKEINDAVFENMPRIRNDLIMLFGNQDFAALQTSDGKERLRQLVLETIQVVLEDEIGRAGVEEVFFTNFVMQ